MGQAEEMPALHLDKAVEESKEAFSKSKKKDQDLVVEKAKDGGSVQDKDRIASEKSEDKVTEGGRNEGVAKADIGSWSDVINEYDRQRTQSSGLWADRCGSPPNSPQSLARETRSPGR